MTRPASRLEAPARSKVVTTRSRRGRRIAFGKARGQEAIPWRAACWRRSPAAAAAASGPRPRRGAARRPARGHRGPRAVAVSAPPLLPLERRSPRRSLPRRPRSSKRERRAAADAARSPVQLPEFGIVEATTAPVVDALAGRNDDDQSHAGKAGGPPRRSSNATPPRPAVGRFKLATRDGQRSTTGGRSTKDEPEGCRGRAGRVEGPRTRRAEPRRETGRGGAGLESERRSGERRGPALIRTLVPPDIKGDTVEGLRHRAARVVAQAAAQAKRRKRGLSCVVSFTPSIRH